MRNRFKGLGLIDRVPDELWNEVRDIVQETGIKTLKSISHFHCIIIRDLIRSYMNGPVVFPTFFSLSLNLAIRSS